MGNAYVLRGAFRCAGMALAFAFAGCSQIPLKPGNSHVRPEAQRAAYVHYLLARVAARDALVTSIEMVRHAA